MLSEVNHPGEKIRLLPSLKKIYKLSGALRDLQLQQKRVEGLSIQQQVSLPGYLDILSEEAGQYKDKLSALCTSHLMAGGWDKAILPDSTTYTNKQIRFYFQATQHLVASVIRSGYFSHNIIHTIRKKLKDLFYNQKTCREAGLEIKMEDGWRKQDDEGWRNLLNDLGAFQDICTAIAFIKPGWLDKLELTEKNSLQAIKKQWIKEKMSMHRVLIEKLKYMVELPVKKGG
jgi:hypothetical protein